MNEYPVYRCPRMQISPITDGRPNDQTWKDVPAVALVSSETGEAATKPTLARMCWDGECLYILFECEDTDIYGTMLHRDDPIYNEDVVEVFLSPDCDLTHYYELEVSPRNVVFDAEIFTDNDLGEGVRGEVGWTCEGWKTAVAVQGTLDDRTDTDTGWSVEMAVPFASLGRPTPAVGERWRGNLYRIDRTPEPVEHQAWSPTFADPPAFHRPYRFGVIEFADE